MGLLNGQCEIDFDNYLIERFGYSDYRMILEILKLDFFDHFMEMHGEEKTTSIGKLRELEERRKIERYNEKYCEFYNNNLDKINP